MTEGAFIDATCPKCGRRIGWFGRMADRPPCTRCGHQVPQAQLQADQRKMDEFAETLAELRRLNPDAETYRKARIAAGLTLRQAAKLLEVAPSTLSAIEMGQNRPSEALAARMARCYGGEAPP